MFYHSKEYFILSQLIIMAWQTKKKQQFFLFSSQKRPSDKSNHHLDNHMEDFGKKKLKLKMHQNVFCLSLKFSFWILDII